MLDLISQLSSREIKVLLRLGRFKCRGISSKHSAGFRDYEVADDGISEKEVGASHVNLSEMGFATRAYKIKYNTDIIGRSRPSKVWLIDLTDNGVIAYIWAKSETRAGLDNYDLKFLDDLFDRGAVLMQDLPASVLLSYIDYVDLSERTGYSVSRFAREILSEEDHDQAQVMIERLRDTFEQAPRVGMLNSDTELVHQAISRAEMELSLKRVRKNILKARLIVLWEIVKGMAIVGTVGTSVIAVIQYLNG